MSHGSVAADGVHLTTGAAIPPIQGTLWQPSGIGDDMTTQMQCPHAGPSTRRGSGVRGGALGSVFLLALLLVAAPTAASGQFPAPTTAGIQATYASEETAPPMRMRARFPDHRIEGAVVGGALGVGFLALFSALNKEYGGLWGIKPLDPPVLFAVGLTGIGMFVGSVIPKQQQPERQ